MEAGLRLEQVKTRPWLRGGYLRTSGDNNNSDGTHNTFFQVLPTPRHFEQASELVPQDSTRDSIAYGADVGRHVDAFRPFAEAGVDVVHISQMGGRHPETSAAGFFEFYADKVLPRLRELA